MKNQNLNVFGIDVSSLLSILPKSPLGLVIAIAIGLGIGVGYGFNHYKATNKESPVNVKFNYLTRAEYERLQIEMSLVEVEVILGRGTEIKRSTTTRVFIWNNPNGDKITGIFENGKLTSKVWE